MVSFKVFGLLQSKFANSFMELLEKDLKCSLLIEMERYDFDIQNKRLKLKELILSFSNIDRI